MSGVKEYLNNKFIRYLKKVKKLLISLSKQFFDQILSEINGTMD